MTKSGVIAIVGATASGKSSLALVLAEKLNAEIICMDSMQIYRGMDIGTAKPTMDEQARVPHHLLDIIDPMEPFAVADYVRYAEHAIADVTQRGRVPMLVGGTGLYLQALMHGLALGGVKSDEAVRSKFVDISNEPQGNLRLYFMLDAVDPITAKRLHPNDVRRVIRALEVFELTGIPMSEQKQDKPDKPYEIFPIGLLMPRELLFERIALRVHQMMAAGLIAEVEQLLNSGISPDAQSMQGIGYKEMVPVIKGEQTTEEAAGQLILNTRHFAKKQGTWFRKEKEIHWIDALSSTNVHEAASAIQSFLTTERA
ncbi:MAG: tRNA (adenosine(37)-N6)-dimethylallyltransferase MiaA [Clostridiales bacterium]|nr:tRNA (adenosine(37)-N6)-dimethylallyltransferase MiaA [Clostridiales bacterium]